MREDDLARQFIEKYIAIDPKSPYPNKSVLFKTLFERLKSENIYGAIKGQGTNYDLGNHLRNLFFEIATKCNITDADADALFYYLTNASYMASTDLTPDFVEILMIGTGIMAGDVKAKLEAMKATAIEYAVAHDCT